MTSRRHRSPRFFAFPARPLPQPYPPACREATLYEKAAQAPRLAAEFKDDFFRSLLRVCLVRRRTKVNGLPRERDAAMDRDDADGYVLVRTIPRTCKVRNVPRPLEWHSTSRPG